MDLQQDLINQITDALEAGLNMPQEIRDLLIQIRDQASKKNKFTKAELFEILKILSPYLLLMLQGHHKT